MISEIDTHRIKCDAQLAISTLYALYNHQGNLSEEYLEEKVKTVQSCLNFMRSFLDDL